MASPFEDSWGGSPHSHLEECHSEPLCKGLKQNTFSRLVCSGDSFRILLSVLNF